MSLASRLYHGETSFDIVGRRRLWFTISGVLVLVSLISLIVPGLNFGIDFKGGAVFRVQPERPVTEAQVRRAVGSAAEVVQVTENEPVQVIVQTEELAQPEVARIRTELASWPGSSATRSPPRTSAPSGGARSRARRSSPCWCSWSW